MPHSQTIAAVVEYDDPENPIGVAVLLVARLPGAINTFWIGKIAASFWNGRFVFVIH